ncbi:MAG TPA: 4-alpha-glucanotransferase, partial [Myxococcota bacterium]|nr:4-alpha-glucanotransferase [Myxococcota bacterium]
PKEVPGILARWGILSSRVVYFEKTRAGAFKAASSYSKRALVTVTTHDHAPVRGFVAGRDLELRRAVGVLQDDDALAHAKEARQREVEALKRRLRASGCLPEADAPAAAATLTPALHRFLRQTPAPLAGLSLDDLAGEVEPVNVPGVSPEDHPSWTRRMGLTVESMAERPEVREAFANEGTPLQLHRHRLRQRRKTAG